MSSIHEVAKKAGVSTATVSRTFRSPDLLNEHTQQRVLEAARQLNYKPRRSHPAHGKGRNGATNLNAIGFQFFASHPSDMLLSNSFYASILSGAQAEAAALGLHLLLHTTDRRSLSQEVPKMILEQAVGGMLLVGTAEPAILATFAQHVPKIVLVDNRDKTGAYESIVSDGFGGALTATRHLLALGHRRIGFFMDEPQAATFQDRLQGYFCAQLERGCAPDLELILSGRSKEESGVKLGQMLRSSQPPTAVLAANDENAFAVMRVCRDLGLHIPEDLSLIGFDDIPFSAQTDPPLTTIQVDKEMLGRLAVRRLHARLRFDHQEPSICNLVPVSLIERDTCRARF